jgi:hypothetical protein
MYQAKSTFAFLVKINSNKPYHMGLYQTWKKNQREANGGTSRRKSLRAALALKSRGATRRKN